jgi:heme exporter protein D
MMNMQFESLRSLLYMNGHGIYVWAVLIIFLIVIIGLFLFYKIKINNFKKENNEIN